MFKMSNWTVVTGFFELPDKGSGYSLDKYKEGSKFTLDLDVNMVIYCDCSLIEYITEERSKFKGRTKIYPMKIADLPYSNYVENIEKNRKEKYPNGYPDQRNTSWYFILTMSKFTLLRMAIEENSFKSSHFAWIDFKYSQNDAKSKLLYEALQCNRDLFSCCLIDYYPKKIAVDQPQIFYQFGGPCTVAAGFFTAKKEIMLKIIQLMDMEFLSVIRKKYGHAEQQLMYVLLLKYPELFDFYVGDYPCLLLNYVKPVDMSTVTSFLIPHILFYGDQELYERVKSKLI